MKLATTMILAAVLMSGCAALSDPNLDWGGMTQAVNQANQDIKSANPRPRTTQCIPVGNQVSCTTY